MLTQNEKYLLKQYMVQSSEIKKIDQQLKQIQTKTEKDTQECSFKPKL